jgi:predicted RNase H-like HicB family nuclease
MTWEAHFCHNGLMKVREAIRLIEDDGWYLKRIRGSHRQYRHAGKPGLVTMGKNAGYSAYSPDLPGCVSTGATQELVVANMKEALALHIDGLRDEGHPVPPPSSWASYVEIAA